MGCTARTIPPLAAGGDMTYVSSPVAASVASVLVGDQQSVEQGALLVQLDAAPLRAALEREQSRLEVARAELQQARTAARVQAAAAAAGWSRVLAARNSVRENVARLRWAVTNEKLRLAERALAERQYERAVKQAKQREITPDEMDERRASLEVAKERVEAATAAVAAARSVLGLAATSENPAAVPEGIEREFVGVKTAYYEFSQALAALGYPLALDTAQTANDENPLASSKDKQSFHEQLVHLAAEAPSVRLAAAHVSQVEQQVRQAEVALAQAEIRAPVAGIVSSRAVNPGDLVEPGQTLLVIRSAESSAAPKPAVESVGTAVNSK
jgi:multidrug resistance efflux pump